MIDYDLYNERRQQLIERFSGEYVYDFLDFCGIEITELVDLLDWEDKTHLAEYMGWIEDVEVSETEA